MFLEVLRDRERLIFTKREITAFIGSACIVKRVISYIVETVASCTAAILVIGLIIDTKLKLICFFASVVLNWLFTHLFNVFGSLNRLCELKHLT